MKEAAHLWGGVHACAHRGCPRQEIRTAPLYEVRQRSAGRAAGMNLRRTDTATPLRPVRAWASSSTEQLPGADQSAPTGDLPAR